MCLFKGIDGTFKYAHSKVKQADYREAKVRKATPPRGFDRYDPLASNFNLVGCQKMQTIPRVHSLGSTAHGSVARSPARLENSLPSLGTQVLCMEPLACYETLEHYGRPTQRRQVPQL